MKKFTCKEMGGPCDEVFEGETAKEVGDKGGEHIMSSTDELHKPMKDQMSVSTEEDKQKWWNWFEGEWNKKVSM
jgi:cell fate regulator YaaT (PSP1 superfamily)